MTIMMTLPITVPTIIPIFLLGQLSLPQTSIVSSLGHTPPGSASLVIVTFLVLVPAPHVTLQDDQGDHSRTQGQGSLRQTSLAFPGSSGHAPPGSASLIVMTFLDLVPSPHDTLQADQSDHS